MLESVAASPLRGQHSDIGAAIVMSRRADMPTHTYTEMQILLHVVRVHTVKYTGSRNSGTPFVRGSPPIENISLKVLSWLRARFFTARAASFLKFSLGETNPDL